MGHGAPDHVRMQDVNIADYTDKTFYIDDAVIPGRDWYYPLDLVGVGCIGLMYFRLQDEYTKITIEIDGIDIFNETLYNLWRYHISLQTTISDYVGISKYDYKNTRLAMWVDYHYLRAFKKSLKIGFYNSLAGDVNTYNLHIYYKLKE